MSDKSEKDKKEAMIELVRMSEEMGLYDTKPEHLDTQKMQREIKFRVYDTEKKKLSYGFCIQSLAEEMVLPVIESYVSNLIWQQYTGLKDKNGVEIYEGDKIIFDNSDIGGQRYEGVVEWNTDPTLDGLCFGLFIPPDIHGFGGWLSTDFLGDLEVVGNIFEGVYK